MRGLGAPSLIDEIVPEGSQRVLAEALRAEVDAYIAADLGPPPHLAETDVRRPP